MAISPGAKRASSVSAKCSSRNNQTLAEMGGSRDAQSVSEGASHCAPFLARMGNRSCRFIFLPSGRSLVT